MQNGETSPSTSKFSIFKEKILNMLGNEIAECLEVFTKENSIKINLSLNVCLFSIKIADFEP